MKKLILGCVAILAIFLALGAWSQRAAFAKGRESSGNASATPLRGKKILVAYFSHSGNTREVANTIHNAVGGDLFEIQSVNPYPTSYNAVVEQAKKEQAANYRPKLKTRVVNFESYDVVFLGYPNWWGTIPMPVASFLSEYNFSGKTIAPFCTHEGSRLGRSEHDIRALCPQATLLEGLAIRGRSVGSAQRDVSEWLYRIHALEHR